MAYRKACCADRQQISSGAGIGVAQGTGRRGRWSATRVYWLLLILFAMLQIADVVTTNYALAVPGVWEANPLMALSQSRLGAVWWAPKVAVVGLVCFATPLARRQWPMVFSVCYYAAIVSINLAHL